MENNKNSTFKNCLKVWALVWNFDKKIVVKIFVLLIGSVIIDTLTVWVSASFINTIVSQNIRPSLSGVLFIYFIIYSVLPVVNDFFNSWYQFYFSKLKMLFQQYMDDNLLLSKKHIIDVQTLESPRFASLLERVHSNSGKIFMIWEDILLIFKGFAGFIISVIVLMLYRWWFVIVLVISVLPDLYLENKYGKTKWGIWNLDGESRKKYWDIKKNFMIPSHVLEIKIYKTAIFFKKIISNLIGSFIDKVIQAEKERVVKRNYGRILIHVTTAFLMFYMMKDIVNGGLLVGTFIFYITRLENFRNNLVSIFQAFGLINSDNPFVEDIFKFLDTPKVLTDGTKDLSTETPEIEFKNVSFKYPETEKFILQNINVKIKKGEKVAIVGVNGAGKTTFTKLLLRFYDVSQGEILLDGEKIKNIKLDNYYAKIGYLPQDYAKYKLTIKEAIAVAKLGEDNEDIALEKVISAAKKAGADEFINAYEKKYDTQLGKEFEGGVEPSVGQWQKLALARLFYKDPQIWILDEPTASIDAVAEIEIFNELENLPKNQTVILISHRFNTVKNADKIIVIEHGEIQEIGSHKELMQKENGVYKVLFDSQKDSYL